jgi:hypothetical protein
MVRERHFGDARTSSMGEAVAMTRSACASSLIIVAQTVDALRSFSIAGRSTAPIVVVAATVCRLVVLRQKTRCLFLVNLLTQYGHLGSVLAIATIKY